MPPFLLIDSKQMWRRLEKVNEDGELEVQMRRMDGWKVVLLHTQTFQETVISASRGSSGPCYTVKGPAKSVPVRGDWKGRQQVKQHVLRFPGTEQFQSHIRQRYEPELAEKILTELGVSL